jgi:hypothetical protein
MQRGPFFLVNCKPGKMLLQFKNDRFVFFLLQINVVIALVCANVFSDGIVLRNGMQMVVTIRDTSGDSISIQEGMWEAGIAKSFIASFWYKGNQYSYVSNNKANRFSSSTALKPIKKSNPPNESFTNHQDSSIINQKQENNITTSSKEDLLLSPSPDTTTVKTLNDNDSDHTPNEVLLLSPDTVSAHEALQPLQTVILNDAKPQIDHAIENSDTALQTDLDMGEYDTSIEKSIVVEPQLLFDPEYTNEELVKKKRGFKILLIAGCALGATSTTAFIASNNWDVKLMSVPAMIASIPLSTIGTIKSIEYRKRLKSAEYKKRRAQMSLSLQFQKADLLITF